MTQILAALMSFLSWLFPGLGPDPAPVYSGYVEAEFVYVAPAVTRRITSIAVDEGDEVAQGQFLFGLEATQERAALDAAQARQAVAAANLHNLETGSRAEEIRVVRASLDQALADQSLARTTLERSQNLFSQQIVSTARIDSDRAGLERANALVAQLRAQLEVAELPARDALIIAARASREAAMAEVAQARAALDDTVVSAPAAGLIEKRFFEAGEVAAAGTPVVSIFPPGRAKVLFYIPEVERLSFAPGMVLALECDGCPAGAQATVTRMATDPQYTPPIIYSRDERNRLVFRAEAALAPDMALLPGQPVTLTRLP